MGLRCKWEGISFKKLRSSSEPQANTDRACHCVCCLGAWCCSKLLHSVEIHSPLLCMCRLLCALLNMRSSDCCIVSQTAFCLRSDSLSTLVERLSNPFERDTSGTHFFPGRLQGCY